MTASNSRLLEKTALLFDVGKFVARVQDIDEKNFAQIGAEFLSPFLNDADGQKILSQLTGTDDESKNIYALISEAATLASGTNRRKAEGYGGKKLENIFNIFGEHDARTFFEPQLFTSSAPIFPTSNAADETFDEKCADILDDLKRCLEKISLTNCETNDLLQILERCLSFVPAGTAQDELSDISLFDHAKLTAAYAVCLQKYFCERGGVQMTELEHFRGEEIFLLAAGDVSGIQQFIYTIPSKGALKSLRGRSFYLEILLEHFADEILTAAGLSRSCLLYTGGGHFYLLLPNTSATNTLLENFSERINDWLLQHFDSRLYLAVAWTPCRALEFIGQTETGAGAPFRRVSEKLDREKLCRYSLPQLKKLFTPESSINKSRDASRECGICHSSAKELDFYNATDETLACNSCRNLFHFGNQIINCEGFIVAKEFFGITPDALELPSLEEKLFLFPSADEWKIPRNVVVRKYVKKRGDNLNIGAIGIWLADYVTRGIDGDVLTFEELAALSCGDKTGLKRLAVMRADVDNLGAAFIAGFTHEFATFTRYAVFSRQMAYFFKHVINFICTGDEKRFSLFAQKNSPRNVHVVYSGGDDVFLTGAWDDLIELAVDLRKAFGRFTNGKLTFSAGLGFFLPKIPVAELARKTGELEDAAKNLPDKDGLALFGAPTPIKSDTRQTQTPQRYSWKEFVENVCGEKLRYLQRNFKFDTMANDERLTIGKAKLYEILSFSADTDERRNSINLARFAYLLARLNPGEKASSFVTYEKIREQFYFWFKNHDDRKALRTATELVLYSLREKG